MRRTFNSLIAFVFMTAMVAMTGEASADISITKATLDKGKLVVTGKSPTGSAVELDRTYKASISKTKKTFSFSLTYLPSDCIVELEVVGAKEPLAKAVIADCGPKGVIPSGSWSSKKTYVENNLVLSAGGTWRALANKTANKGKSPASNPDFWQVFAAKGDTGPTGPAGPINDIALGCLDVQGAAKTLDATSTGLAVSLPCDSGYTVTGGSCVANSFAGQLSASRIRSDTQDFQCAYKNTGASQIIVQSTARCCKVPAQQ